MTTIVKATDRQFGSLDFSSFRGAQLVKDLQESVTPSAG